MTSRRKRILVLAIDDHMLIQLEHLLEDQGFETSTTWDPAEALQWAKSRHFDLLMVGDHPPEVSASEFLRQLQCGPAGSVPCMVLQNAIGAFGEQYFYSLGASGVIADRRYEEIVRRVQEWFSAQRAAVAV